MGLYGDPKRRLFGTIGRGTGRVSCAVPAQLDAYAMIH
jgi:hypothetical protein